MQSCGYSLDRPEGWGYFHGKPSQGRDRSYTSSDGHTAAKTEIMKSTEDQFFQFVLSWIEGGSERGWTFHYRPKHSPLSPEFDAGIGYLRIRTFEECPCFDFEPCYWNFVPFDQRGSSAFDSNAEAVHKWFDAHEHNFSQGINSLLSAQSFIDKYDMYFLPIDQKELIRTDTQIKRNIKRSVKPLKRQDKIYDFDVSISFAGTERSQAEALASSVRDAGFDVFYDDFYPEQLWGRDLITFFDDVYRKRSRYCVIFVSSEYCERMWTNHERKSAQARALQEKGNEYILPIQVDNSELPGLQPTTGYLSMKDYGINKIAGILIKKLNS